MSLDSIGSWLRPFQSPRAIERYRTQRLLSVVRHAARNVPYYRRRFAEAGFDPFASDQFDLAQLPPSSKADFQSSPFEDRVATGVPPADRVLAETSGSTGEPMRIVHTPAELTLLYGLRLRSQILSGLRPWHRRFVLGSAPKLRWQHRLGLFRVTTRPLTEPSRSVLAALEKHPPDILRGPPSALELLVEQSVDALSALRLKRVFTGAEQLSPRTRRLLEAAAGCRVVDFFGACECNLIAWECVDCGLYHTCDDNVIVEVLRDGRPALPGEEGELFITALHCRAMPFLRYRIGDVVRLPKRPRPCRVRFGAIERIEGRNVDYLVWRDGSRMSPYTLMDELDPLDCISRYEVEQENPGAIIVYVQPAPGANLAVLEALALESCRRALPREVAVSVRMVERFTVDPSRKRRFVRSLTPSHVA